MIETKISEKPILFNAEMVKAILDGRKTQTRRVITIPIWGVKEDEIEFYSDDKPSITCKNTGCHAEIHCPFDADQLWVRETWYNDAAFGAPIILYRANGEFKEQFKDAPQDNIKGLKWKPSIFMFRKYSRIQLKVKNIRVERVQDISKDDVKAEGLEWDLSDSSIKFSELYNGNYNLIHKYFRLWNSLNEKRGFGIAENPWVWVIKFEIKEIKGQ